MDLILIHTLTIDIHWFYKATDKDHNFSNDSLQNSVMKEQRWPRISHILSSGLLVGLHIIFIVCHTQYLLISLQEIMFCSSSCISSAPWSFQPNACHMFLDIFLYTFDICLQTPAAFSISIFTFFIWCCFQLLIYADFLTFLSHLTFLVILRQSLLETPTISSVCIITLPWKNVNGKVEGRESLLGIG